MALINRYTMLNQQLANNATTLQAKTATDDNSSSNKSTTTTTTSSSGTSSNGTTTVSAETVENYNEYLSTLNLASLNLTSTTRQVGDTTDTVIAGALTSGSNGGTAGSGVDDGVKAEDENLVVLADARASSDGSSVNNNSNTTIIGVDSGSSVSGGGNGNVNGENKATPTTPTKPTTVTTDTVSSTDGSSNLKTGTTIVSDGNNTIITSVEKTGYGSITKVQTVADPAVDQATGIGSTTYTKVVYDSTSSMTGSTREYERTDVLDLTSIKVYSADKATYVYTREPIYIGGTSYECIERLDSALSDIFNAVGSKEIFPQIQKACKATGLEYDDVLVNSAYESICKSLRTSILGTSFQYYSNAEIKIGQFVSGQYDSSGKVTPGLLIVQDVCSVLRETFTQTMESYFTYSLSDENMNSLASEQSSFVDMMNDLNSYGTRIYTEEQINKVANMTLGEFKTYNDAITQKLVNEVNSSSVSSSSSPSKVAASTSSKDDITTPTPTTTNTVSRVQSKTGSGDDEEESISWIGDDGKTYIYYPDQNKIGVVDTEKSSVEVYIFAEPVDIIADQLVKAKRYASKEEVLKKFCTDDGYQLVMAEFANTPLGYSIPEALNAVAQAKSTATTALEKTEEAEYGKDSVSIAKTAQYLTEVQMTYTETDKDGKVITKTVTVKVKLAQGQVTDAALKNMVTTYMLKKLPNDTKALIAATGASIIYDADMPASIHGVYEPTTNSIIINENATLDQVIHEVGHLLFDYCVYEKQDGKESSALNDLYIDILKTDTTDSVTKNAYAIQKNYKEFYAEVYNELATGKSSSHDYFMNNSENTSVKKFVDMIINDIKEAGGDTSKLHNFTETSAHYFNHDGVDVRILDPSVIGGEDGGEDGGEGGGNGDVWNSTGSGGISIFDS